MGILTDENIRRFAFSVRMLDPILFLRQNVHHFNAAQQATDWIILRESQISFAIKSLIEILHLFYLFRQRFFNGRRDPQSTAMRRIPRPAFVSYQLIGLLVIHSQRDTTEIWYFLIPATNREAYGWCMLRHFPGSLIFWSSASCTRTFSSLLLLVDRVVCEELSSKAESY